MDIQISLPGGKRVDAQLGGFTVHTDQPRDSGGEGSAPDPFSLFLASIGACAGYYVVAFCQARGIATDGISLTERTEQDPKSGKLTRVSIEVELPEEFPVEYRDAVVRAAGACKVKKTLLAPPELTIVATNQMRNRSPMP
jgi:putative redox protein